jgi:quercetin dioxygenase-like cupin family protein
MYATDYGAVEEEPVKDGVTIRWVISQKQGAPNFALRVVEFGPGVVFPEHSHPYEHEIFVLEGHGVAEGPDGEAIMKPGTAVLIPPSEPHSYRNVGSGPLRFICVIPNQQV